MLSSMKSFDEVGRLKSGQMICGYMFCFFCVSFLTVPSGK